MTCLFQVLSTGFDNENSDLVLYVGEALMNHNPSAGISRRYVIQDMLGQVGRVGKSPVYPSVPVSLFFGVAV